MRAVDIAAVLGRGVELVLSDQDQIAFAAKSLQQVFECFANDTLAMRAAYLLESVQFTEIVVDLLSHDGIAPPEKAYRATLPLVMGPDKISNQRFGECSRHNRCRLAGLPCQTACSARAPFRRGCLLGYGHESLQVRDDWQDLAEGLFRVAADPKDRRFTLQCNA